MIKTAGIGVATYDALSDKTRKKLKDYKKNSQSNLDKLDLPTDSGSGSRSLSSSKSDSLLPQVTPNTGPPISQPEVIPEVSDPDTVKSLTRSSVSAVQLLDTSPTTTTTDNLEESSRSLSFSMIPSAPSCRPSSAAKKMAKKVPKPVVVSEENTIKDIYTRPETVPINTSTISSITQEVTHFYYSN